MGRPSVVMFAGRQRRMSHDRTAEAPAIACPGTLVTFGRGAHGFWPSRGAIRTWLAPICASGAAVGGEIFADCVRFLAELDGLGRFRKNIACRQRFTKLDPHLADFGAPMRHSAPNFVSEPPAVRVVPFLTWLRPFMMPSPQDRGV